MQLGAVIWGRFVRGKWRGERGEGKKKQKKERVDL